MDTETTHPWSIRDADGALRSGFIAAVDAAVQSDDSARAKTLACGLHEADLGDLLEALEPGARLRLVELLGDEFDFAALNEVDVSVRDEILEELPPKTVAEGMCELESDDAIALLEDLDSTEQSEILDAMPATERVVLRRSLDYPENSAGRLMQTTLVAAPPFRTTGEMLDALRDDEQDWPDSFFEVFVVDHGHRLLGTVFLDTLARSSRSVTLGDLKRDDRRRVRVTDDQDEVARMFERYNLVSAPVVDEGDRLVGVITIDDIVDVIQEAADQEIKALGGVNPSEGLNDPLISIARSRFVWLFVNLLTAFAASSIIGLFQSQLQQMVALAVLAPIVASQGGNAGTQTMTVAVRALGARELSRANAGRIIGRELLIGLFNGLAFGLLAGAVAAYWFGLHSLGFVIGLAMLANLLAAAFGGIVVPLAMDRLKIDPAIASGAFVTTITDVVGYFAFLTFASLYFGLV